MSDKTKLSRRNVAEEDTLPLGVDVSKVELLDMVAGGEWKRPAGHVRAEGAPAEAYWYERDEFRLRFERNGRIWQGFLDELGDVKKGKTRRTSASENIGKVARELKKLVQEWEMR